MSDVLSQSEIDALLDALTSGDTKPEALRARQEVTRIRTYDFRRAMRFSKDHLRSISRIHDHFSRLMTTYLSGQLRSMVQWSVQSVDQVPYEEFIRSIPDATVTQVVELQPLLGSIAVNFHSQVVFAMLDRLMGGIMTGPYPERELTEIENALFRRVAVALPNSLKEAWKNVLAIEPRLVTIESNPQFLQLTTPNETVLVISIQANIGATSGIVSLCIPHVTLEPVMDKLTAQRFMEEVRTTHEITGKTTAKLATALESVEAEVTAVLGEAELTFQEVLELAVGDIIPLSSSIQDPVHVFVNHVPKYIASTGIWRKKYAVQIQEDWEEVNGHYGEEWKTVTGGN